ncbi:hypothetical protein CCACVL1_25129, partial [Corchorus capsularis]
MADEFRSLLPLTDLKITPTAWVAKADVPGSKSTRSYRLIGTTFDVDAATAKMEDGVLTITVPMVWTLMCIDEENSINLPMNLDAEKGNGNSILGSFLKQNGQMTSCVPLGPFTGYASVLKSSKFLKPAQQILDDFCGINNKVFDFPLDSLADPITCSERIQHRLKNSKLFLMLDE